MRDEGQHEGNRAGRPQHRRATRRCVAALAAGLMAACGAGAENPRDPTAAAATADSSSGARERLVDGIERNVRRTRDFLGTEELAPVVLAAIRRVPRDAFVPPELRGYAYGDHPLPIGHGQTISQPYVVAVMTHLAGVGPGERVYELGTGSGYQAAVLAEMGVEVYSVEIVPELAQRARETLATLGYDNVHVRAGDGWLGWPEAAPFDAALVTAAHPDIPHALADQLKTGGRMVMPVGDQAGEQWLMLLTKQPDGRMERREVLPVRFVPVTGKAAE